MTSNQTEQGKAYADKVFRQLAQQLDIPVDAHTWKYEEDYLSYTLRICLAGSSGAVAITFSCWLLDDCANPSNTREREKLESTIRSMLYTKKGSVPARVKTLSLR